MILGWLVLLCSVSGILGFLGYPYLLRIISLFGKQPESANGEVPAYAVSILLAVRNGVHLLEEKLANLLETDLPGPVQILICSDGSNDGTAAFLEQQNDERLQVRVYEQNHGKAFCLSHMLADCTGEILIFTDADAIFAPDALTKILAHFRDPHIGGVCARRVIREDGDHLSAPQSSYIDMDSKIKQWETQIGSLTSNDGKLYAVRASLVDGFPGPVTDDLWQLMNVVLKGHRFVFEPNALVYIRTPARSLSHEYTRRRRIVSTSLNGIWRSRALLNPFRFGGYALCLFINKVDRRLLPFWLLGVLLGCVLLTPHHWIFGLATIAQLLGYLGVFAYQKLRLNFLPRPLKSLGDKVVYILVGNLGMLMGTVDFVLGRTPDKWEPKKTG